MDIFGFRITLSDPIHEHDRARCPECNAVRGWDEYEYDYCNRCGWEGVTDADLNGICDECGKYEYLQGGRCCDCHNTVGVVLTGEAREAVRQEAMRANWTRAQFKIAVGDWES